MNDNNSRRGFLKGFGLFSAVLAGGATHGVSSASTGVAVRGTSDPVRNPVVDQSLAPTSDTHFALIADNTPREAMRITSGGTMCYASPTTQENLNRVALSVGKDNRLWAQIDGQWRRVALEG